MPSVWDLIRGNANVNQFTPAQEVPLEGFPQAALDKQAFDVGPQGDSAIAQQIAAMNAPAEAAPQQVPTQFAQAAGMGANPYEKQYIDALISAQGLQKEGIGSLQDRIKALQNAPDRQDGLQQAVIMAADMWGGGAGQFGKAYNEANPNLDPKQRQAAITQLEDTLRKSRGDLSDSQIAVLKAKMGFEEAKLKAGQKADGAQLPAGQAERIADLSTIGNQIDDLENQWISSFGSKRSGPNDYSIQAGLRTYLPGSEESMYEDSRKLKAQTIGKALEGGKLTDVDYTKYMKFIPSPGDTPARAKEKIANLRKYAGNTKSTLIKTLGQSGYKVSGIENGPSSGSYTSGLTDAEKQELAMYEKKFGGK